MEGQYSHTVHFVFVNSAVRIFIITGEYSHAVYPIPVSFHIHAVRTQANTYILFIPSINFHVHAIRIFCILEGQYSLPIYSISVNFHIHTVRVFSMIEDEYSQSIYMSQLQGFQF